MAKKKAKIADDIVEIKKLLEEKRVIIGSESTIKNMRLGKIEKVYLASNCSDKTVKDIEYYGKIGKVMVIKLNHPNDELGVICKKPFSISVLSALKV